MAWLWGRKDDESSYDDDDSDDEEDDDDEDDYDENEDQDVDENDENYDVVEADADEMKYVSEKNGNDEIQEEKELDKNSVQPSTAIPSNAPSNKSSPTLDAIPTEMINETNQQRVSSELSDKSNDDTPKQNLVEHNKSTYQQEKNDAENKDKVKDDIDATSEEAETETTFGEKVSVLALAAEHDRVDIIQAILNPPPTSQTGNSSSTLPAPSDVSEQTLPSDAVNTKDRKAQDDHIENNKESNIVAQSEREMLLNPLPDAGIPPLHIAVSFGSTNAVNCLLRIGADPSIRPDIDAIVAKAQQDENSNPTTTNGSNTMWRYDDLSAWELIFGLEGDADPANASRWSLFSSSSSNVEEKEESTHSRRIRKKKKYTVDIVPAKKDMIRHAFTAEALRSIGSDEHERLQQLLDSGMPRTIEIGNKTLHQWALDMNATQCQKALSKEDQQAENVDSSNAPVIVSKDPNNLSATRGCAVLDRRSKQDSLPDNGFSSYEYQLQNQYNELKSLSEALSTCLDNLAEEVSVCNGLLLTSNGNSSASSSLARHVRTLKATKERKDTELEQLHAQYDNIQDELAYWIEECWNQHCSFNAQTPHEAIDEGIPEDIDFADQLQLMEEKLLSAIALEHERKQRQKKHASASSDQERIKVETTGIDIESSNETNGIKPSKDFGSTKTENTPNIPKEHDAADEDDDDDIALQRQLQLQAQIVSCENKIRQLRSSISDLSEENARNLDAVERRGLFGGINLVRAVRSEIRDIDFSITEFQNAIQSYENHIKRLQHLYDHTKDEHETKRANHGVEDDNDEDEAKNDQERQGQDDASSDPTTSLLGGSKSYATVTTTDMVTDPNSNIRLLTLWQIILRIIGIKASSSSSSSQLMSTYNKTSSTTRTTNSYIKQREKEERLVMIV